MRRFRKRSPVRRGSVEVEKGEEKEKPAAPTPRAGARVGRKQEWLPGESSADGDDSESAFGRSASLRSNTSTHSFLTTMRRSQSLSKKKATPKEKKSAENTGSMLSRGSLRDSNSGARAHRRRSSESDVPIGSKRKVLHKPPLSSGGIARLSQDNYGGSVNSLTPSELESIAEDDTMDMELGRVPTKISEDPAEEDGEFEDTFDFAKKRAGGRTGEIDVQNRNTNRKGKQPSAVPDLRLSPNDALAQPSTSTRDASIHTASHSPSRAKFSLSALEITPPKHTPPPRSVSPAKSALKHAPSSLSQDTSGHSTIPIPAASAPSEAGSARKVRVSFSDEDSIASFSPYSRPPLVSGLDDKPRKLPVFGSVGRGNAGGVVRSGMVPTVLAPSPPTSDSSADESDIGSVVRWPRGRAPLGNTAAGKKLADHEVGRKGDITTPGSTPERTVTVPELVLIIPTPKEEKREEDRALPYLPGGFPSGPADDLYGHGLSIDAIASGDAFERRTADVERDSDSDSFSGDSIYSDAYEDPTAIPKSPETPAPTIPGTPELVPLSAVRPRSGSMMTATNPTSPHPGEEPDARDTHAYEDDPPLPPDFLKSFTAKNTAANGATSSKRSRPMPIQRQYSSSSSSTVSFSDDATDDNDADSVLSESSFQRMRPRERRTGMMSSMRNAPPTSYDLVPTRSRDTGKLSKKSTTKGTGMRSSRNGAGKPARTASRFADSDSDSPGPQQRAPFRSRFADDSDDDIPISAGGTGGSGGKLKKRTDSTNINGTAAKQKGRNKGFWGMFSKKGKKKPDMVLSDEVEDMLTVAEAGLADDKEIGGGAPGGRGMVTKKSKPAQQEKEGVLVGTQEGTTVAPGGSAVAKEVGMGDLVDSRVMVEDGNRAALKKKKKFTRLRKMLRLDK